MPETNDSPDPVSEPISEAAAARAKFEQEKMSRRAALRKIGLTSGMALFGMFAVDDLARLAMRGLQQHKETQAVAETVAQELRGSGVAFAADGDDGYYDASCTPAEFGCSGGTKRKHRPPVPCQHCCNQLEKDNCVCFCLPDANDRYNCYNNAKYNYDHCTQDNCESGACSKSVAGTLYPCDPCTPVSTS